MYDTSATFRGRAGDVICGFVQPGIFLTLIPVFGFWCLVSLVLYLARSVIPEPVAPIIVLFAAGMLVGRFAIGARNGDLRAGFFNAYADQGLVNGFALRYCILTAMWSVPLGVAGYVVASGSSFGDGYEPWQMASAFGVRGFYGLAAIVVLVVAPAVSLIMATVTESISDIFHSYHWLVLVKWRRQDFLSFFAAFLGGMAVFVGIYLIPAAVIIIALLAVVPALGAIAGILGWFVPAAAVPVLLGRLCGAFAIEDEEVGPSFPAVPAAPAPSGGATPEPALATKFTESSVPVAQILQQVEGSDDLDSVIAHAEQVQAIQPMDFKAALQLVYAYSKTKRLEEAKQIARQIIPVALQRGDSRVASALYRALRETRYTLTSDPKILNPLSAALIHQGHYSDGARCYDIAHKRTEDRLNIQRELLQIAEKASEAKKAAEALAIYEYFLRSYADSSLADFARKAAEVERMATR